MPGIDYLLENLLPTVEAEKPVPQDLGTGGGRSQWCNRLLEALGTRVAGFLLDGEAEKEADRSTGVGGAPRRCCETGGDREMRRMRRAVALAVLCMALLTLGAGAVWAATLIACPNVPGTDQCLGTPDGDIMTGTAANDSIAGLRGRDRHRHRQ